MLLSPLRLFSWLMALIVVGLPLAAVTLFLMATIGSPGTCEDENRPISDTEELAILFQQKWDQLDATLDSGQASGLELTDSEVTSRARTWLEEHDAPVSDLRVCFTLEGGAASGKVDVPFFPSDVDVLIRGTMRMTGEQPEITIDELKVGSLPGPITNLVENFINDLIDDQTKRLDLVHDYGLAFDEGLTTVSGTP